MHVLAGKALGVVFTCIYHAKIKYTMLANELERKVGKCCALLIWALEPLCL